MTALDEGIGNPLNDALLNNGSSGTVAIGAKSLTLPYTVVFDGTLGTASVTGTAITGTSSTTLAGKVTTASASVSHAPTKANDGAISITTTTSSGTWNGIRVQDSTGTPNRLLYGPASALAKAYGIGDILSLPIGNLSLVTG